MSRDPRKAGIAAIVAGLLSTMLLVVATGCSAPGSSSSAPRVERVFAHVRGVT